MEIEKIALTDFSLKHFKRDGAGTKILDMSSEEFEENVNFEITKFKFDEIDKSGINTENIVLKDGYADFCKLLFVGNFTKAKLSILPITIENSIYLRSSYEARTSDELPILARRFQIPPGIDIPVAKYLCIILYSKEQLKKEHEEGYDKRFNEYEKKHNTVLTERDREALKSSVFKFDLEDKDVNWGIVSILSSDTTKESPIVPITMMRNALGPKEGGSGVPLNKEEYMKSVEFWDKHALISY